MEIFFDVFVYNDALLELYDEYIIKNNYGSLSYKNNKQHFCNKILPNKKTMYAGYYNQFNKQNQYAITMHYLGIYFNYGEKCFSVFSNFDLWLNSIYTIDESGLVDYAKNYLDIDYKENLKKQFPHFFNES